MGHLGDIRRRANSVEDSVRRGQRQVEQTKIKLGMQIDDKHFQNLLIETQVHIHGRHECDLAEFVDR